MTDVSNDGKEIWDWADRLSDRIHLVAEIKTLSTQIHQMQTTCGSCSYWMTSSCHLERCDQRGRKTGPSSQATVCGKFVMTGSTKLDLDKANHRLVELQQRLK
jgi:hypothetical protein